MVFSSVYFLLYFLPIFLLLYLASPAKWKNIVALVGSCYFYMWGAPEFFFLLLFALILDFYLVRLTHLSIGPLRRRLIILNIALNVSMLLVAKYLNFFVDSFNPILGLFGSDGLQIAKIALPIGISFITFQRLSYVIDCYRGKSQPLDKLSDYLLYILLFPQLIAGPIVRFNEIVDQLKERSAQDNIDYKLGGMMRFIVGLARKVLIADQLAVLVDQVFAQAPESLSAATLWIGAIAYSFQIYNDFAGYSDMAIGIAMILGFRFPENFNFPYIATSITEFWRRWHITLGSWMRDYLYIPLGGNRVSENRMYFNLWFVFLISGLWHGAAWTFVLWGAFHGLFLFLERVGLQKWLDRIGQPLSILYVYLMVLISWVIFRAPGIGYAFEYLYHMFAIDLEGIDLFIRAKFWWVLLLAVLGAFAGLFVKNTSQWYQAEGALWALSLRVLVCLLIGLWCLTEVFGSGFHPFIYFQF